MGKELPKEMKQRNRVLLRSVNLRQRLAPLNLRSLRKSNRVPVHHANHDPGISPLSHVWMPLP